MEADVDKLMLCHRSKVEQADGNYGRIACELIPELKARAGRSVAGSFDTPRPVGQMYLP
jgi:hypothetical protein